jgi:RNA polymerase sigma factor (sigma-70 family)
MVVVVQESHEDLVIAARRGSSDAFAELVKRFEGMAFSVAYSMLGETQLAQDAVQEAFLAAYLNLHRLRDPAAFPGWFKRIVIKQADRIIRKRFPQLLDENGQIPVHINDPALTFDRLETQRSLQTAIRSLPSTQRLPVQLYYLHELSQQDIADFLGLPVSTIKKRLFDARQKLKETITMTTVSEKIEYFIALKENDMLRLRELIEANPDLVHLKTKTEWEPAPEGYYFPRGITAAVWAAATGNIELLEFVESHGADIIVPHDNGASQTMTRAVGMQQQEMVRFLIGKGVPVNGKIWSDMTPLHRAVLVGDAAIASMLIDTGADLDALDAKGHTPADWAKRSTNNKLRRLFGLDDEAGAAPSRPETVTIQEMQIPYLPDAESTILETGIKIVDCIAPLKRGGHNGIFTPLPGVGKFVLLAEIMTNFLIVKRGKIVSIVLEEGSFNYENMMLAWRDLGLHDSIAQFAAHVDYSIPDIQHAVKTAYSLAEHYRSQGQEVLFVADSRIVTIKGMADYLVANQAVTPRSSNTVLYHGENTPEADPEQFGKLDSVITFDLNRAKAGMWPAVDLLRSRSPVVSDQEMVDQIQAIVRRFQDLNAADGLDKIGKDTDRHIALRAQLLDHYFTQPFHVAEAFTALPGEIVPLKSILKDVRRILDGELDDTSPDQIHFIASLPR